LKINFSWVHFSNFFKKGKNKKIPAVVLVKSE
jgi:hypothetical protein